STGPTTGPVPPADLGVGAGEFLSFDPPTLGACQTGVSEKLPREPTAGWQQFEAALPPWLTVPENPHMGAASVRRVVSRLYKTRKECPETSTRLGLTWPNAWRLCPQAR